MSTVPTALPVLPASVHLAPGVGGLPIVRVTGRAGSAEVYLHGAHVASWVPAGGAPVLWMSAGSRFTPGTAIRGGIPICFPWFGPNAADATAPAHGFARVTEWQLSGAAEVGDDVVLTFHLTDSPATRASAWPHPFEARYTVTVGATLRLELTVINRDTMAVTVEEALHSYFAIDDIHRTTVAGLEGVPFLDKVGGATPTPGSPEPVSFTAETDRVYSGTTATTTIDDGTRRIAVTKTGSDSTVVWNPWIDKAAAMADFGSQEWTGMVCVETCNVGADAITLDPGASHTMTAEFTVTPAA
ncbi:D-hexose-6-phosphate mutarotase [Cryobacterium algoricola]|nr:D-hexose-6-phosphate mutarotase [Cryobacterium algoricola]